MCSSLVFLVISSDFVKFLVHKSFSVPSVHGFSTLERENVVSNDFIILYNTAIGQSFTNERNSLTSIQPGLSSQRQIFFLEGGQATRVTFSDETHAGLGITLAYEKCLRKMPVVNIYPKYAIILDSLRYFT